MNKYVKRMATNMLEDAKKELRERKELKEKMKPLNYSKSIVNGLIMTTEQCYNHLGTTPIINNLKHNETMYQLLPDYALKQVVKAMTHDYHKNGGESGGLDWRKGSAWSKLMGESEYHYREFKACNDFDEESGLYHLAHFVAKGMMLLEYHRIAPQFDDRNKPWLTQQKIVLDIDEVVCDWHRGYCAKYGENCTNTYWDSSYKLIPRLDELAQDKDFWVNLDVLHRPDFLPHAYVSSRSIPVEWTQEFLEKNNLPCRPVYHVPFGASKIEVLKEIGATIFIDDNMNNCIEAEKAGIAAFMMDAFHNQHYNMGYRRIYDLSIKNIIR